MYLAVTNLSGLCTAFFFQHNLLLGYYSFTMETKTAKHKEIIILLLAEMRNYRLIEGLRAAGLHTDNFYTKLTDLILEKTGFDLDTHQELRDWYEEVLRDTVNQELRYYIFHERELAEQMYNQLLQKKDRMVLLKPQSARCTWTSRFKKWMMG